MESPSPPPRELTSYHVGRARTGDRESLEWLVGRFSPLLLANAEYRLGKTLRELYDPEDIVNDVWLATLPKLPQLPSRDGRFTPVLVKYLSKTLLYRINNLIEKHIRNKPRKARAAGDADTPAPDPVDQLPDDATSLVTRLVRKEAGAIVAESLKTLPDRDRELIVLRGIEQRPYKEISAVTGIDAKVLAVQYQRAIEKLRKALPGAVFDDFGAE